MNREEKAFLLEMILRDIRGSWGYNLKKRVDKAEKLAMELGLDNIMVCINEFREGMKEGRVDGRHFRNHEYGYNKVEIHHNLNRKKEGKSKQLIESIENILVTPENVWR